jgi:hypothetical protein
MHGEAAERLRDNLCEFIAQMGMERIDQRNIEPVYMAMVAYEKSLKAEMLEEELEGGYSNRGYSREGGYSSGRDSMGRYSREGGASYDEGGDSYRRDRMGRYSRDDGKKHLKEQVEMMMRQAGSPQEKEMAHKFMELLEKS